MKNRIIVCGYPKSGNTWLTRLTAEVVGCPVEGFWCSPFNLDIAIEGHARQSDYRCFKAHTSTDELARTLDLYGNGSEKVIYIYRDPRAVAVSALHYYHIVPQYRHLHSLFSAFPYGSGFYHKILHTEAYKLDTLVKGLVLGSTVDRWLHTPWKEHVEGFKTRQNTLFLSYEALQADTLGKVREICQFLSLERTETQMREAIKNQSFDRKKNHFQQIGDQGKVDFMRKGKPDAWKTELAARYVAYLEEHLGSSMTELGYALTA